MVEKISQSNYRLTSVGLIMPELNGVEEEYVYKVGWWARHQLSLP